MPLREAVMSQSGQGRARTTTLLSAIVASSIMLLACGEAPTGKQFDGVVSEVDGDSATINTKNGSIVAVDGFTSWTSDGAEENTLLGSLSEVKSAVEKGRTVHIEGEGIAQTDGDILATRLKARAETDDR